MSVNKSMNKWVRLGDYIKRSMANNNNLKYGIELIEGVNSKGEFCDPKAAVEGINLRPYKIVQNGDFVYNPSRLDIGSLAYRQDGMCIVSHLYVVFRLNDLGKKSIIPEFLYLFFNRDEFLRLITYLNFGSQRPEFNFYDMSDIQIPLPNIEVQRELVATYNGLKALAEQNEALIKPLTEACQAYIVDCKRKYPEVELGEYIQECTEKNRDSKFEPKDARGVYSNGTFGDTLANLEGSNLTTYKVVKTGEFAYSNRINIGSIAQNNESDVLVSPSYTVFRIKSEEIMPKYLFILFRRKEFLRSTLFFAIGTIKDDFSYERMAEVKIPLPPPSVQQAIVNLYNCAEEAKNIANEAREKMKTLCPALVQKAINS
jgi:type I restriction enzyme S subunit